jgi:hypothetical protein
MKRRTTILLVSASLMLVVGLAAGLTLVGWPDAGAGGEPREFPDVVYESPRIERAYRLASDHQDLFAHVACYCGCVNLRKDAHRNLLDCFMNDDGSFESHALGCTICLDIAEDAAEMLAQGKSADEIPSLVDDVYRDVGPPTVQ